MHWRFHHQSGSVLVPVVAAMLILVLAGVALTEQFGSQRMRSVLTVDTTRAHWIAEAGLWHAAHEETELTTPISFAGGTYTVAKSGNVYTSTATRNEASRSVSRTFTGSGGGGDSPLDEAASEATATKGNDDDFTIDLVSIWPSTVVIEGLSLSADVSTRKLERIELDSGRIWRDESGVDLPTGTLTKKDGLEGKRTIPSGASRELFVEFKEDVDSGPVAYTLVLDFTNRTSSTLNFTINW